MRRRVLAIVLGLAAISPFFAVDAQAAPVRYLDVMFDEVDVTTDVVYGNARNSQGVRQDLLLDLYQPAGDEATGRALYIWAHGSGFRFGDKDETGGLIDYVHRGWVGMSMTYRMRPELPPNAAIGIVTEPTSVPEAQAAARDAQHDMQAAVRYARAHADELGIDPNKIAVGGSSAGGIIALMTAFNETSPGNSGNPGYPSGVAAAVSHAGAYVPILQGAFPLPGAPPIAIYHGTTDNQVPIPTSIPGCVLTIAVGNTCEYVAYVARIHRTMGTDLALNFLYRHVIIGPELRVPLVVGPGVEDEDPDVRVVGGVETPVNLGADAGVVVPTDPELILSETEYFVQYVAGALGI
jgi:predicted esterase